MTPPDEIGWAEETTLEEPDRLHDLPRRTQSFPEPASAALLDDLQLLNEEYADYRPPPTEEILARAQATRRQH